jgi:charged multivesicular body protein 5
MGALDEKIASLDKELIRYKDQLKKTTGPAAANIKKRALETLKRKKMYEQQRDMVAGQQFNVDQTSFAIDSIKDTQTIVAAMKTASVQLKAEQKKVNIAEIEDMQDDLYDIMEDMNEINEVTLTSFA